MIYILKRASEYNEKSPCEEAVLRPFENWQERSCTEEYFDEHYSPKLGLWRSKGLNHTTTLDGNITQRIIFIEPTLVKRELFIIPCYQSPFHDF